MWELLAPLKYN